MFAIIQYDNYGNILTKNGVSYTYGDTVWKDKLTKIGEETIFYDVQGNPTSYLGHTLTWKKGRQLKSFDGNTYTYNANGIRTSKTVDGVRHDFVLDDAKILRETWGGNTLTPLYDNEDSVCGIIYNNEPYYFQKNLQGDIIGIVDKNSTVVARYSYDAWGKVRSVKNSNNDEITSESHIAIINPFRYRGYYFDQGTNLYYLQSRYYDAEVGRFINGDETEYIAIEKEVLIHNLFAYCGNDCVNLSDSTGKSWLNNLWKDIKKGVSSAWDWLKKKAKNLAVFFKDTVCQKWIKKDFWNTFCKKWVWEEFSKEMVYNTFIKKWVWQTFCKKWTWNTFCKKWTCNTFCKKWVWEKFCKKWAWETFCKEWIAKKAWTWINGNKWYQILSKTVLMGLIGFGIGVVITDISIGAVAAAILSMVVTFIWEILSQGWNV